MSRHHGYLEFVGGQTLEMSLTSAFARSEQWQQQLTAQNTQLYAVPSPPQVSAAFVLQHLLSIPAQVGAFGAATGPWLIDLGTLADSGLSVDLAAGHYPERLGFTSLTVTGDDRETRLEAARTAYTALGDDIATAYEPVVKMSTRQRLGMVRDQWLLAERDARAATGDGWGPTVERESCCFIYALPGCHECAGCPRLGDATRV